MSYKFLYRLLLLLVVQLFVVRGLTSQVQAHTLKSSGSVGAVMHVSPEDEPIAGEQSDFFFEFKDTKNSFSPATCDCTVAVQKSGETIFSKPLFSDNTSPSLSHASFSYTFPEKNIYSIVITGKPIRGGTFADFRLSYATRVDREAEKHETQKTVSDNSLATWLKIHAVHALPALAAVLFIGYIIYDKRKK